jgi:hypothetical protein
LFVLLGCSRHLETKFKSSAKDLSSKILQLASLQSSFRTARGM